MAKHKVLVTGGAGFIGSFIVDQLVSEGHDVRILDNLEPQVHGGRAPDYLNKDKKVEFVKGSVLDYEGFKEALNDIDVVLHEACRVGIGQSMYEVKNYVDTNISGTANLLNILANENHDVRKLVIASSFSGYGEGAYDCASCGTIFPPLRPEEQLKQGRWEPVCSSCGKELKPTPTPEKAPLQPTSIYAVTKAAQEQMALCVGKAYGIPSVALRYFCVYGPRQSLSNPYTGVAAIFISRIKNNSPPLVFEDGLQTRDFVSVHDIARANMLAMKSKAADYEIFNVGCGRPVTIKAVAETVAKLSGKNIKPTAINEYRKGDIRHCIADISKIENRLGFRPRVSFEEGMRELIKWSEGAKAVDMADKATKELLEHGLIEKG